MEMLGYILYGILFCVAGQVARIFVGLKKQYDSTAIVTPTIDTSNPKQDVFQIQNIQNRMSFFFNKK